MSPPIGPAVVTRVGALLRVVAKHREVGLSTTDAAREVGLTRPTAHRLLGHLLAEGLVDRDPRTGSWFLGPELYVLGVAAAGRYDITQYAHAEIRHLAELSGESAFLSVRRGPETVCLLSEEGSFPLRSHVLHVGIRFPLGVASAGLAILAHLPDAEIDRYLAESSIPPQWQARHEELSIRARIDQTRADGYATNPGLVVEGSWGLAAAVFDLDDRPAWALSLTGVASRFDEERRPELGAMLLHGAHRLTRRLRQV